MGKSLNTARDRVLTRSEGKCERCGVELTFNVKGIPDGDSARSLHHRQPRRCGGKDSIFNLVYLCVKCHRLIHDDEDEAARDGWIVIGTTPVSRPFRGWQGWVLPMGDGSLMLLDFDMGRAVDLRTRAFTTPPKRVATRSRQGHRKSKRPVRGVDKR